MSLWTKPANAITFADVDAFCQTGQPEGMRLDYKWEWPENLEKTIAAFANTLGGIVLLGVDADKTTNKPIWPAVPPAPPRLGLPSRPGLAERVIQIARDNIYPPVLPEVSPVLENAHVPGQAAVVIRVPESKDAPHAVEKRRKVYVYARRDNVSDPHELADIDHIAHLLNRRRVIEEDRERQVQNAIQRARRHLAQSQLPMRWGSIIPFYPWRDLCTAEQTWALDKTWHNRDLFNARATWEQPQRAPGGSFTLAILHDRPPNKRYVVGSTSMTSRGHIFSLVYPIEFWIKTDPFGTKTRQPDLYITEDGTRMFLQTLCDWGKRCYAEGGMEQAGYLLCSIGVLDAFGLRMADKSNWGSPFPDSEFRAQIPVPSNVFIDNPKDMVDALLKQLAFGFDLK
jgi:Putative DNA-binding domain